VESILVHCQCSGAKAIALYSSCCPSTD